MKRPGITAFVFTALATGAALVLGAGPAHADRDGTCNSGDICFWNGRAYSGDKLDMTYSDPNHTD
ncbi:MAG TPA: peptidase inhibitor family I36 protein, partial [Catenuloplanes sp.]